MYIRKYLACLEDRQTEQSKDLGIRYAKEGQKEIGEKDGAKAYR